MQTTPAIMLRGTEADAALHDADFVARWLTLLQRCPYATVFQRPEFVRPWYSTYRREWEPIVLLSRATSGELTGLWLLAWNESRRSLIHAGAQQAEYHTWLASAGTEAPFLKSAWMELRQHLAVTRLSFQYLPDTGLAALLQAALGTVSVRKRIRRLWRLDPQSIQASLATKKTRYRFNRLKRLGPLEFRRIVDPEEFDRVFDELADFYDFRHGATHHTTPFRTDSRKREFHRALFTTAPQHVILTVTYLAGRPIAGFWGFMSAGQALVSLVIHSPFLTEHSPGILHLMQLSEHLSQNGIAVIDLSPGGDAWKARFANDHDEVALATLHASRWQWLVAESGARAAKRALGIARVTPQQALSALGRLRQAAPVALLRDIRNWLWERREIRIYRADRALALRHSEDSRVRCNSLPDLLRLQPTGSSQGRYQLLSTTLARLEQGESVWTLRLDDGQAQCGWTTARGESRLAEVDQTLTPPPDGLLLRELHCAPASCTQGLCSAVLGHTLRTAFADDDLRQAYTAVPADDGPLRHVIEDMGFRYQGSFYWQRRFGRVAKWADPALRGPEPA